jgi:hypothetical protein
MRTTWVRLVLAPPGWRGADACCAVPEPNLDGHVFCRVLVDKGDIEIDECVVSARAMGSLG